MEAIKKKMQAMRAEKDNAVERAETAESMARDANEKAEKVSLSCLWLSYLIMTENKFLT